MTPAAWPAELEAAIRKKLFREKVKYMIIKTFQAKEMEQVKALLAAAGAWCWEIKATRSDGWRDCRKGQRLQVTLPFLKSPAGSF